VPEAAQLPLTTNFFRATLPGSNTCGTQSSGGRDGLGTPPPSDGNLPPYLPWLFAKARAFQSRGANRLFGVRTVYRGYEHRSTTGMTQTPDRSLRSEAVLHADFVPSFLALSLMAYHGHELRCAACSGKLGGSDLRMLPSLRPRNRCVLNWHGSVSLDFAIRCWRWDASFPSPRCARSQPELQPPARPREAGSAWRSLGNCFRNWCA